MAKKPQAETEQTDTLWTLINNINEKTGGLWDKERVEKVYSPWVVNVAFANFIDTLVFAETLNGLWSSDPYMQYVFLFHAVDARKRFSKWHKRDEELDEKINMVKEFYDYSSLKAREIIPLIDKLDGWDELKASLNKGGKGKMKKGKKTVDPDSIK